MLLVPALASGCSVVQNSAGYGLASLKGEQTYFYPSKERACLERAMFFESNRKSREGLIAVGTVVMNRLHSSRYPDTICGVVGQKNQFAPGVLTRAMNRQVLPDVQAAADAVLKGERHPKLKNALFFHTAGLHFPYHNMHYVLVAGGNAFYEKRRRDGSLSVAVNDQPYRLAYAFAQEAAVAAPPLSSQVGPVKTSLPFAGQAAVVMAALSATSERQETSERREVSALHEIPVPLLKTTAHLQEMPGYAAPDARKTDQIGAWLLAQQNNHF